MAGRNYSKREIRSLHLKSPIPRGFLLNYKTSLHKFLSLIQLGHPINCETSMLDQAKQIFSAAAKADGIPFEPDLIQTVINELEIEEFVRPAELQVVGTRLNEKMLFP